MNAFFASKFRLRLGRVKDTVQVKENLRQHVMEARKQTGTRDIDVAAIGR